MLTAFIILFIIFLLLIIPVELIFNYSNVKTPVKKIDLSWLFGAVSFEIYPKKPSTKTKKEVKTPPEKKKSTGFSKFRKILGNSKFTSKTYNTIRSLLRSVKPDMKRLYLKIGLDDPADTGMFWGFFGPISGLFYGNINKDLVIVPDFLDPSFDIETEGKLSVVPLEILIIVFSYIFSPVVLKTYWFDFRGAS